MNNNQGARRVIRHLQTFALVALVQVPHDFLYIANGRRVVANISIKSRLSNRHHDHRRGQRGANCGRFQRASARFVDRFHFYIPHILMETSKACKTTRCSYRQWEQARPRELLRWHLPVTLRSIGHTILLIPIGFVQKKESLVLKNIYKCQYPVSKNRLFLCHTLANELSGNSVYSDLQKRMRL
jgi:hypothetical protein